ncbi:hypothetical protein PMIN02_003341 [Paraphaeosphaeria minitans]
MPALSGARATGASDKHETPGHVHQTHIRLPGGVLLKGHFALRAVVALGLCFMKANIQLPSYTAHHATYSVTCIAASQEPANPLNRAQRFHLFDRVSIASRHRRAVVVARKLLPLKEEPPRSRPTILHTVAHNNRYFKRARLLIKAYPRADSQSVTEERLLTPSFLR